MKHMKKALSMLLVLCMVLSFVPLGAAAEGEEVLPEPTAEQTVVETEPAAQSDGEADAPADEPSALSEDEPAAQSEGELTALSNDESSVVVKGNSDLLAAGPQAGSKTSDQPFAANTAGSQHFRIPALVTLSDGTLVAAADARYTTTGDGGGLDTILSTSTDSGNTWNNSFPFYFPDSDGYDGENATTIIDPVLVAKGNAIYLMADVNPTGMTTLYATPGQGTGYITVNGTERLALTSEYANSNTIPTENDTSTYEYYVGNFNDDGYAIVYLRSDNNASGYLVDEWYNLYQFDSNENAYVPLTQTQTNSSTQIQQNVFYKSSALHVFRTGYMWLATSEDGGETWHNTDLNPQIKRDTETGLLVSPGRGTVLSDGTIVIPFYNHYDTAYTYENETEFSSFIWSKDDGKTWTRTEDIPTLNACSESEIVELSNGTLRMFVRSNKSVIAYADAKWDAESSTYVWQGDSNTNLVKTSEAVTSTCNVSAIKYSQKTLDGRDIILVSQPGGSDRTNGKIFTYAVDSNGSMTLLNTYQVNTGAYQYSCLTELYDGSIGLLYENGSASIIYQSYSLETIAPQAYEAMTPQVVNVTVQVGGSKTFTDTTGSYSEYSGELNQSIAGVALETSNSTVTDILAQLGSDRSYNGDKISLSDCLYTFTASGSNDWIISSVTSDGTPVYLNITGVGAGYPNSTSSHTIAINAGNVSSDAFTIQDQVSGNGGETLYFWRNGNNYFDRQGSAADDGATDFLIFRPATASEDTSSSPISGYVQVTSADEISSGGQYLIAALYNKTYYVLHPSVSTSDKYAHVAKVTNETTTMTVSSTDITITGVAVGETSVVVGNTQYNITVVEAGSIQDTITVSVGETVDVESHITLTDGQTVKWTVDDGTYAGVYSEDGTTATVLGRAVGETKLTATVYSEDGSVAGTYIWAVTVTSGSRPNEGSYKVTYKFDCTIYNGTLYYSIDGGPLKEAVLDTTENDTEDGEVGTTYTVQETDADVSYSSIVWFVKPNEGYAVTSLGGTANVSYGLQFYAVNKEDKSLVYKTDHNGNKLTDFLTTAQEKALLEEAVAMGCDAIFWNSRGSLTTGTNKGPLTADTSADGTYVIHCDKLPTVDKVITSITSSGTTTNYTEGMKIKLGDTINYTITVNYYDVTGGTDSSNPNSIAYTNLTLTDELTNGNENLMENSTSKTVSTATSETYNTKLTVTMKNYADVVVDGEIINTVDLTYTYQSAYSSGSYGGSATAEASISIEQPEYVIDFGLPVSIDLSEYISSGIAGGTAYYGTISANGNSFTYTPTRTLEDVEHVVLTLDNNAGSFGVTIYPATTVYYEEGFATYSESWTGGSKGTGTQATQATQVAGESTDEYGYDAKYAVETNGASNDTQATSNAKGDKAEFAFTGTGVEIYTNSTRDTGNLMIQVKNSEDATVKLIQVATALLDGTTEATTGQAVSGYNVPVASITGLTYGSYTVNISHTDTDTVNLDGFRVYGTLEDQSNTVYTDDQEDDPTFIELRDRVLASLIAEENSDGIDNSQYAKQIKASIHAQVYATANTTEGAVVISASSTKYTQDELTDLLDNGPKNEIYLQQNQSLVFKINTDREVQIGLKALNASTSYTINDTEKTLSSSTDMFYTVLNSGSSGEQTITITNTGDGILAITKLKVCDDPNAALGELTEDDLTQALIDLGLIEKPEDTFRYNDLPEKTSGNSWYFDHVYFVRERHLMVGDDLNNFNPTNSLTREEAAVIMVAIAGIDADEYADTPTVFTDVKGWSTKYIVAAYENGLVAGMGNGIYAPQAKVTREQFVTMLEATLGIDANEYAGKECKFSDVPNDWSVKYVVAAYENGLVSGYPDGTFGYGKPVNRAEAAVILCSALSNSAPEN